MTIEELIPVIEREAKKLSQTEWEDLTVIGLTKAWLVVRNGRQVDKTRIIKVAKNAMVDSLRRENRRSNAFKPVWNRNNGKPMVELPYLETGFQAIELEELLKLLKPTLRRAIRKRLDGEALTSTERMALLRFRKSGNCNNLRN